MSFQDVGKPGSSRPPKRNNAVSPYEPAKNGGDSTAIYEQLSDGIMQYQRNVGLLEKITRQIGTKSDGPVLQTQFRVQVDVIKKIGSKIESQLRSLETSSSSSSATSARSRATHVKLNRDYQRVVTTFRNLQLESKRKWDFYEAQKREKEDDDRRRGEETRNNESFKLQLTQQQDRIYEDIVREREEEIRNINKGMHQVNEIYKDLAHLVGSQQEDIDQIETNMQQATESAKDGLHQVEQASASQGTCIIS